MEIDNMQKNKLCALLFFWMLIMINNLPGLSISPTILHIVTYAPLIIFLISLKTKLIQKLIGIISISFIIYGFHTFMGRSYLFDLLELLVVPSIIASYRFFFKNDKYNILLYTALTVYVINCGVSLFEYQNKINLFYEDLTYFERFRSSGIWGHPLYNALIHGGCMIFIVLSKKINSYLKIVLWFLGIYVMFCFDARAATIMTTIMTIAILYINKIISKKNLLYIIAIGIIFILILNEIGNTELGGKLFNSETNSFEDGSSRVRRITIEAFFKQPFDDILLGVDDQFSLANKYGIICFENSIIALILRYGLVFALIIIVILIEKVSKLTEGRNKKEKYIIVLYILTTGITSMALTSGYVWICYISFYLMICGYNNALQENTKNIAPPRRMI